MAKVRVFKNRRPLVDTRHRPQPNSKERPGEAEHPDATQVSEEEGVLGAAQSPPRVTPNATPSQRMLVHHDPHFINVPDVEDIMRRVHARTQELGIQTFTRRRPLEHPHHVRQPRLPTLVHPRPSLLNPTKVERGDILANHEQVVPAYGPSENELRGYAGLEGFPYLEAMMDHPKVNSIYSFFYRFGDANCPAGVMLADPLDGNVGERGRHCPFVNKDSLAWLYVRRHGDRAWRRDLMAAKGNGRHAVYLQRCEPGYKWEQQLGQLLDTRKSLNLWVAVKL